MKKKNAIMGSIAYKGGAVSRQVLNWLIPVGIAYKVEDDEIYILGFQEYKKSICKSDVAKELNFLETSDSKTIYDECRKFNIKSEALWIEEGGFIPSAQELRDILKYSDDFNERLLKLSRMYPNLKIDLLNGDYLSSNFSSEEVLTVSSNRKVAIIAPNEEKKFRIIYRFPLMWQAKK